MEIDKSQSILRNVCVGAVYFQKNFRIAYLCCFIWHTKYTIFICLFSYNLIINMRSGTETAFLCAPHWLLVSIPRWCLNLSGPYAMNTFDDDTPMNERHWGDHQHGNKYTWYLSSKRLLISSISIVAGQKILEWKRTENWLIIFSFFCCWDGLRNQIGIIHVCFWVCLLKIMGLLVINNIFYEDVHITKLCGQVGSLLLGSGDIDEYWLACDPTDR